jgi:PEP-CTERM motif
MKSKNILTLIVAAGLTLFAAHANAVVLQNDVVFNSSMSSYNIYLEFDGTKWTKYDNGSMPANVYSATTGTGSTSRDPLGYTIAAVSGQNPYVYAGSSTSFKLLVGGGVNIYGESSTKAVSTVNNQLHLVASLVPNNTSYVGLAYNLNVTTKYFGWLSYSNNSDGSQIKIISAYLNPTANESVTVGVTHNSGGAVAYGATTVPEPSTYGLIGIAALGVAFAARRRKLKTA